MKFSHISQLAGVVVSIFMVSVKSHSWIDNLQVVGGVNPISATAQIPLPGNPTSKIGYIRDYPDVRSDIELTNRIMDTATAAACKPSQQKRGAQNPNKPVLSAAPGSLVQGNYTENGHISLPNSPLQKPGTIYWYGTKTPYENDTFTAVVQWTEDGTGGDRRGKLLAKPSSFDDGVCVEKNGSPISLARQAAGGGGNCKSVFKVPEDLKNGDVYTVYWFWDFSDHFGEAARTAPGAPQEWYTSCMDINIVAPAAAPAPKPARRFRRGVSRIVHYGA